MAARARRLAHSILDRQAITGLTKLAQDMEARAAALETQTQVQTFSHSDAAAVQKTENDTDPY